MSFCDKIRVTEINSQKGRLHMKTLFTFILIQLGLGAISLFFNHISIFESIFFGILMHSILLTNTELDPTIIILICVILSIVSIGLQRTKVGLFLLSPLFSLFWGWWFSYLMFTDSGNVTTFERYIVWGIIGLLTFGLHLASYRAGIQKRRIASGEL